MREGNGGKNEEMGGLDNGGQRDWGRGNSVSCRKMECDGTRKSGRDKRSEQLIERLG